MTDEQQAGRLAFLQNFYTGVTLYMPFEAEERAPASPGAAAAPIEVQAPRATPAPVALPPAAPAVQSPRAAPLPAATPLPTPTPAPVITPVAVKPVVPAAVPPPAPLPEPVAGKLPSLGSLLAPTPRPVPVAPAAAPGPPPAAVPPATPVAPYLLTTFNTLGSNAHGVVLLVRLPEAQFQKLPRNVFLNKLLQAINLVMADVVLVNVDGPYPVALENLRREIAATQVLAFGKNLLDVAVRTTQIYEPVLFPALNLAYLAAAEVEMVEYDVSLKKRLWGGLKAMFL